MSLTAVMDGDRSKTNIFDDTQSKILKRGTPMAGTRDSRKAGVQCRYPMKVSRERNVR